MESVAYQRATIILGSHSAIEGKTIISAITTKPIAQKGIEERKTSPRVMPGGAKAFIV